MWLLLMTVHITANSMYIITTHYCTEQEQDKWSFLLLSKKPNSMRQELAWCFSLPSAPNTSTQCQVFICKTLSKYFFLDWQQADHKPLLSFAARSNSPNGQRSNIRTYSNTWRREKGINLPNTRTLCTYVESLAGHNKDLTETD